MFKGGRKTRSHPFAGHIGIRDIRYCGCANRDRGRIIYYSLEFRKKDFQSVATETNSTNKTKQKHCYNFSLSGGEYLLELQICKACAESTFLNLSGSSECHVLIMHNHNYMMIHGLKDFQKHFISE